jgi:hypothetical protein
LTREHFKNGVPPLAGEGMRKNSDQIQYTTTHERPIDRVLDALRAHGGSVKQSGGQWMCTCPAHDDRNPSLSVKQGDDGRVLLKCFAGCSVDAVADALALEMRDLFPDTATVSSRTQRSKNPRTNSASAPDAHTNGGFEELADAMSVYTRSMGVHDYRWDYQDADGNLVGVVLRWDTGHGKEIRPVSLIDGRWHLRGMPEPRPLYKLPELLNSDGPIIVCEGEKAADAAIACGYNATTNPHGSKSVKQADWSVLRARDVIIIPDLDDAGDAHTRDVLFFSESAKSVRVVDLSQTWPQLDEGDDLADVLAIEEGDADAVRAKLDALIEQTSSEVQKRTSSALNYRPFPVELLPEPVRSYVTESAQEIECDRAFIALPILSMLAAAIGNTHVIRLKRNWFEPSIIWTCIIGKSGAAKSPALEHATNPLREIQNQHIIEHQQAMREWRKQRKGKGNDTDPPRCERCVLDDTTIEGALHVMSENPRGVLQIRDELAEWFDFDRYSSSKGPSGSSRWLGLFGGRPLQIDRRTEEPIHIRRVGMSIAGGIQPEILRRVLKTSFIENGLAARMLFANPPKAPRRWNDNELDPVTKASMYALVERLYQHQMSTTPPEANEHDPKPHTIGLTPEAMERFKLFYNEHNESMEHQEDHICAAYAKLEGYCARFALIIHLVRAAADDPTLEDPDRVDAESMRCAIGLVHWFKHESVRVYSMITMDEAQADDQIAIDWINKQGGAVTINRFSRGLKRYNKSDLAKAKLHELEKKGYGRFQGRPPNGRTQEFVLDAQFIRSTPTVSSCPQVALKPRKDSGASGRYPVPSNRKGQ